MPQGELAHVLRDDIEPVGGRLHVGPQFGLRLGTTRWDATWAEYVWFVGLEMAQCVRLADGRLSLCLTESVAPIGQYVRRWKEVEGDLGRGEEREVDFIRLGFGTAIRWGL